MCHLINPQFGAVLTQGIYRKYHNKYVSMEYIQREKICFFMQCFQILYFTFNFLIIGWLHLKAFLSERKDSGFVTNWWIGLFIVLLIRTNNINSSFRKAIQPSSHFFYSFVWGEELCCKFRLSAWTNDNQREQNFGNMVGEVGFPLLFLSGISWLVEQHVAWCCHTGKTTCHCDSTILASSQAELISNG